MIGMDAFGTPMVPAGAPPPAVAATPATVEPRAIEGSEHAALRDDGRAMSYSPSRALLQLVESSAEDFAELLMAGQDPAVAAAMTGTPDTALGQTGTVVDKYA